VLQESSSEPNYQAGAQKKNLYSGKTQDSSGSKKVPAQKNTDATTGLIRYSLTFCNL